MPRVRPLEDRTLPSTFTVLNLNDGGAGSLRAAVAAANANANPDLIRFASHLSGTITLTSGQLTLSNDVTIDGPGARRITVSGNDASRVFEILGTGSDAVIEGLTITRGRVDGSASTYQGTGGGVLNLGNLILDRVIVSDNDAVGDPTVTVTVNPVFTAVGGAFGGGVANFGVLTVSGCTFTGNQARGADNTNSPFNSFPGPAFPGNALGAGLANFATASVAGSQFTFNTSRAGSDCSGDFAGIAGGGAILNDADMTITGSAFRHNQSLGGSNNVSPFHNGHALGGAIMTGSLKPIAGLLGATLAVSHSTFDHNRAVGGDDNVVTLPLEFVPKADGPNNGYGGAILAFQGDITVHGTSVHHNQTVGGAGGAEQNGCLGVGGGIFLFNFLGGVTGDISNSWIAHNEAVGGAGRSGGDGGEGLGGGVAVGSLGAPFGAPGTVTVSNSFVGHNRARGRAGGNGGDGGNGLGGGLFNDAGSTTSVMTSLITLNQAEGGRRGPGGGVGQGIGGGVYNLGTFTDLLTLIALNHATTSDDDCFGC